MLVPKMVKNGQNSASASESITAPGRKTRKHENPKDSKLLSKLKKE
jgi:hypothetical protein